MVPTAKCIDFFVIVQLDDHPEDIMLTLTSTNEYGADDDVLIWDHLQPWNVSDGESDTFFAHQMVNQTTCIHEDECYTFIVEDMAQDGLTSMEQKSSAASDDNGEFPPMSGYFMLSYDSGRIISYYDGKVDGCYSKKIYKFGLSTDCANTETTEPSDSSCPQVRRRRWDFQLQILRCSVDLDVLDRDLSNIVNGSASVFVINFKKWEQIVLFFLS